MSHVIISTLGAKISGFTLIALLFVSLIGINNNVGATLVLENHDQAKNLEKEVNTLLNSISNIKTDYNIMKNSLSKIINILIEKQVGPGIYFENSELPPLPPTNQSTPSQFNSELPPLPPTNQSTPSQFN